MPSKTGSILKLMAKETRATVTCEKMYVTPRQSTPHHYDVLCSIPELFRLEYRGLVVTVAPLTDHSHSVLYCDVTSRNGRLQQRQAITYRAMIRIQRNIPGNKSREHVSATACFDWHGLVLVKIFTCAREFCIETTRTKSNWFGHQR